jgi:hypothetical protein
VTSATFENGIINKVGGVNAFTLKIIAIIGMIIQHSAMVFRGVIPYGLQIPMHIVGGITFPIMAYFVSEGFRYTSNFWRYFRRLLVFAVIAQIPFAFAFTSIVSMDYNILFTIALGLLLIKWYDSTWQPNATSKLRRWHFWLLLPIFIVASLFVQFSIAGVAMIFLFYVLRNHGSLRLIIPLLISFLWFTETVQIIFEMIAGTFEGFTPHFFYRTAMGLGNLIALALLFAYNGQRGRKMKWFFYIFYPLHLAILGLLGVLTHAGLRLLWF